ncbi:MAG: alpha-L-fucosidase, partial [Spirosomataceae bacterium]
MKHLPILCILSTLLVNIAFAQTAPKSYGVVPTERQLKWHETEMYSLIHFTPTTFENKEWGYGDADPTIFNPTGFDADQIVNAAKDGGMRGIIMVAKHHDGFCLWPTKTTEYNISKSPWRNGKGDMVREFEQACRKAGMKFGIYCSPWDRNNTTYGTPNYLPIYREQLRELYTNYGDIFMSWHDGANGGDGYYGGTNEARKIDNTTYYDWNTTWNDITRKLQPNATIFSDIGPDVRWVGNEKGFAAETHWATFTPEALTGKTAVPGNVNTETSSVGTRNGKYWTPAECDVPLRPGWFYHPEQDGKEKDADYL